MRILRIDSWDGVPGGAQEYVSEVTSELARRGHPSRVLQLTGERATLPPPVGMHIPVDADRLGRTGRDVIPDAALGATVRLAVKEFSPDLVSLHHFDARFATLASELSQLRIPLVFAAHDAELVCPISTLVRPGGIVCDGGVRFRCLFTGCHVGLGGPYNLWQTRVFDRRLRPKIRAYLCPSRSLRDYLDSNGYRPALHLPSFARIPEAVRTSPPPLPDDRAPPTVGYLGRLEWYKGVHDLIAAFASLRRRWPTARLDIAGDGPFRPSLERLARSLGVADGLVFRGRLDGVAKEEWFRGVHLLAAPSNMWENFPLVALEALVRGRPVVGTRIGGIPDIVDDGESGVLVPIERPDLLAEGIGRLLSQPDRLKAMGSVGRERVLARFTPERHLDRLLAVYEAVLQGRPIRTGDADAFLAAGTASAEGDALVGSSGASG